MKKLRTWREYLIKRLADDPSRAGGYLQAALEYYQIHGDAAVFLLALQTVVESQGGISELAKQIDTSPQILSELLASDDLPRIDTLTTILNALGCQILIQPIEVKDSDSERAPADSVIAPIAGEVFSIEPA